MASIVENILGDRALSIAQEEFVRKMDFGNRWNHLRIGVLWRINHNASFATRCRFQLGLNNGDQNTFASGSCAGYLGVCAGYLAAASPVYVYDGVGLRFSSPNYTFGYVTKSGSTVTDNVYSAVNQTQYYAASTSNGPHANVADFYRVSATQFQVSWWHVVDGQWASVPTLYDLLKLMEDEQRDDGRFVSTGGPTSNLTSPSANLDTVSVYWNQTQAVEISALSVLRFH